MGASVLEMRPGKGQEPELAGALLRGDALLRLALGAAWLATAVAGPPPALALASGLALDVLLGAAGLLALAGLLPRTTASAGLALSLLRAPGGVALGPWLALLGAAAARCAWRLGPAAPWLARVHALATTQTLDLVATELRRAEAARSPPGGGPALRRAGDDFERAGRTRRALRELGVEAGPSFAAARGAGRALAALLSPTPRLRRRLAARLEAAARRRAEEPGAPA